MRELALWGARSLGPPTGEDELFPGWLENAIDSVLAPVAPPGRFEFRVGDEIASLVDGEARPGPSTRRTSSWKATPRASTTCSSTGGSISSRSGRPRPAATAARRCTRTRRGDGRSLVLIHLGETQARSVPAEAPATPTTTPWPKPSTSCSRDGNDGDVGTREPSRAVPKGCRPGGVPGPENLLARSRRRRSQRSDVRGPEQKHEEPGDVATD